MPWIHATLASSAVPTGRLASELAQAAANAAGLDPGDVIALVTVADAAAGSGALVTITGRRRDDAVEDAIADAVRQVVATATGLSPDLVAVVRS
jgi:phenylpyruvate tautomerase PptA (4-oxalocrotonate tautomerase family)